MFHCDSLDIHRCVFTFVKQTWVTFFNQMIEAFKKFCCDYLLFVNEPKLGLTSRLLLDCHLQMFAIIIGAVFNTIVICNHWNSLAISSGGLQEPDLHTACPPFRNCLQTGGCWYLVTKKKLHDIPLRERLSVYDILCLNLKLGGYWRVEVKPIWG